jgi:hypothetical protein
MKNRKCCRLLKSKSYDWKRKEKVKIKNLNQRFLDGFRSINGEKIKKY